MANRLGDVMGRSCARYAAMVTARRKLLGLLHLAGRPTLGLLSLVLLVAFLLPAVTAIVIGDLVDQLAASGGAGTDLGDLTPSLVALGLAMIIGAALQNLVTPLRTWTATKIDDAIRAELRYLLARPVGVAHLERQDLRSAATLAADGLGGFTIGQGAEGQLFLMFRFVGAAAAALVLASVSPAVAAVAFVLLVTQRTLNRRQYMVVAAATQGGIDEHRTASYWSDLAVSPSGAKEIRVFGLGSLVIERFAGYADQARQGYRRTLARAARQQWTMFTISLVTGLMTAAVLVVAGLDERVGIGGLARGLAAVIALSAISIMGWEGFAIELSAFTLPGLEQLRALEPDPGPSASVPPDQGTVRSGPEAPVPEIRLEDIYFTYPGADAPVLRGVDLRIPPGQRLAIVGANGAGKTTLVRLLSGLHQPDHGRILVDGVDLRDIPPSVWRRQLSAVLQDFLRLPLSARLNVGLSGVTEGIDDRALEVAAHAAEAGDLIRSLPAGWDTPLSRQLDDGTDLSGGQWQRVALARSFYALQKGSRIVVLDEPTANLDVRAEVAIFDQLLQHADAATNVLISHRFSTVRRADRIVVLSDGVISEDGSHAELMALGGQYATMYQVQATSFTTTENRPDEVAS